MRTLDSNQVDWQQLQRWRIPQTRLPSGTQVLFRVPGLSERYGFYVAGVVVLVVAQTMFIAILFVQQGKRRRAEGRARRSEAELRASYERIRDLGGRLIAAQDAERARIARELHDDISQQVALVALELQMFADASTRQEADADVMGLGLIDRVRMLGRSLHDMSHQLHPAKLRLIGLVPAIEGLRREFLRPGITIAFAHDGVPADLPHDFTLALFRVVQEAVRNAVEHSGARTISVRLAGTSRELSLVIADDGSGFDVNAAGTKGLGLISMRERLDA